MSIFVALGGSGFSHLWRCLSKMNSPQGVRYVRDGMRPDVCFLPNFWFKKVHALPLDEGDILMLAMRG